MLIGALAARTGTTTRALRYYESRGLLAPDRTGTGYRVYGPDAVTRVRNIRELLAAGFTVEDVCSFVRYLDADLPEIFEYAPVCADGYVIGAQRVAQLAERIEVLTGLHDTLVRRMPWLSPGAATDESASRSGRLDRVADSA